MYKTLSKSMKQKKPKYHAVPFDTKTDKFTVGQLDNNKEKTKAKISRSQSINSLLSPNIFYNGYSGQKQNIHISSPNNCWLNKRLSKTEIPLISKEKLTSTPLSDEQTSNLNVEIERKLLSTVASFKDIKNEKARISREFKKNWGSLDRKYSPTNIFIKNRGKSRFSKLLPKISLKNAIKYNNYKLVVDILQKDLQKKKPVYYFTKTLNKEMAKNSTIYYIIKTYEGIASYKEKEAVNNKSKIFLLQCQALIRTGSKLSNTTFFSTERIVKADLPYEDIARHKDHDWLGDPTGCIVGFENNGISSRFGSGFVVSQDGLFLTAGHCLEIKYFFQNLYRWQINRVADADKATYCCNNYQHFDTTDVRIDFNYQFPEPTKYNDSKDQSVVDINIKMDRYKCSVIEYGKICGKKYDYAILKIQNYDYSKYGKVALSTDTPDIGTDIVMTHHPYGQPKKISFGKVVGYSGYYLRHDANTLPGSSGSPIAEKAVKKVIAVHTGSPSLTITKNHGITIKAISGVSPTLQKLGFFAQSQSNNTNNTTNNTTNNKSPRINP